MKSQKISIINKPLQNFLKRFNIFLEASRGTNRGEIQKWYEEDNRLIKKLHAALKKEQEICTIMSPQTPLKLNSFFFVPRIVEKTDTDTNNKIEPIELINCEPNGATLISGRLGQGKSIFLRYLQFLSLNHSNTIPLFLEFQKINNGKDIIRAACCKLNDLGLTCSEKLFQSLSKKGFITFFLDGYDEISITSRDEFNEGINKLINLAPSNRIFITSRYDTEVEKLASLQRYEISPFSEDEHPKFIEKILKDQEESKKIIKKLSDAREFDATVLDTPLLLTWFVMVYRVRRKIPKTKIGFYEELFKTILSRHDGIKGSFDRHSKSGLTDSEIEKVLHAFCYLTTKDEHSEFDESSILKLIQQSLNINDIDNVSPDDYLYDLTHITCLIIKDGVHFGFVHDSIQKYFSACFIKETSTENAIKFYKKADKEWRKWNDELGFLYYLDSYRFHKYLMLPSVNELVEYNHNAQKVSPSEIKISIDSMKHIYSETEVILLKKDSRLAFGAIYFPAYCYSLHKIFNDGHYKICDFDKSLSKELLNFMVSNTESFKKMDEEFIEDKKYTLPINEFLKKFSLVQKGMEELKPLTVNYITEAINKSLKVIQNEESKGDLF